MLEARHYGIPKSPSARLGEVGDEAQEDSWDLKDRQDSGSRQRTLSKGEDGSHSFCVLKR